MRAATKPKTLEPSLADPLEKRDRKPVPGWQAWKPCPGCQGGVWGVWSTEPCKDAWLVWVVLTFAAQRTTCCQKPTVSSRLNSRLFPQSEAEAEGVAAPLRRRHLPPSSNPLTVVAQKDQLSPWARPQQCPQDVDISPAVPQEGSYVA